MLSFLLKSIGLFEGFEKGAGLLSVLIKSIALPIVGASPLQPNTLETFNSQTTGAIFTFADKPGLTILWSVVMFGILIWSIVACYRIYRPKPPSTVDDLKTKFKSVPQ
jgi:hypothetical protein